MVKHKKEKVMVVFDDAERTTFLKSKFNSKNRRKKAYLKEQAKKYKAEVREQKREMRESRKSEIEKLTKMMEDQQKVIDDIEAKKKNSSTFNLKSNAQTVKVTTTYL